VPPAEYAYSVELLSKRATNFSVPMRLPNRPPTAPVVPSPSVWNPEPGKQPASMRMLFFPEDSSQTIFLSVTESAPLIESVSDAKARKLLDGLWTTGVREIQIGARLYRFAQTEAHRASRNLFGRRADA